MENMRIDVCLKNKQGKELKAYCTSKTVNHISINDLINIKYIACAIREKHDTELATYEQSYKLILTIFKEENIDKGNYIVKKVSLPDDLILKASAKNNDKSVFIPICKQLKKLINNIN